MITRALERVLAWLQRRELRRKVKWKDCAWSPQEFQRRMSAWCLRKLMFESHATHAAGMAIGHMVASGIMSREEIEDFWQAELRKIKQRANEMPWGQ